MEITCKNMTYIFHPEDRLIPKAIARAHMVKPDPSVEKKWQEAIYRNLNEPEPTFCWNNFLNSLLP